MNPYAPLGQGNNYMKHLNLTLDGQLKSNFTMQDCVAMLKYNFAKYKATHPLMRENRGLVFKTFNFYQQSKHV